MQLDIFADNRHPHPPLRVLQSIDQIAPIVELGFVTSQLQMLVDEPVDAALLQDQRHLIDRGRRGHGNDGVGIDIAEEGNLFLDLIGDIRSARQTITSG